MSQCRPSRIGDSAIGITGRQGFSANSVRGDRAPLMMNASPDCCARCCSHVRRARRTGRCVAWRNKPAFPRARSIGFFRLFGLQPHRSKSFKLSTDPFFVDKVRDIVGLYLNPPDKALVLCVDEKSQIQALERTQPILPLGLGYVEGITHDYVRHGTTTLFAALEVQSGKVITQCKPRHRHQEFLSFLQHLDRSVPPALDLHLIIDNYGRVRRPG